MKTTGRLLRMSRCRGLNVCIFLENLSLEMSLLSTEDRRFIYFIFILTLLYLAFFVMYNCFLSLIFILDQGGTAGTDQNIRRCHGFLKMNPAVYAYKHVWRSLMGVCAGATSLSG